MTRDISLPLTMMDEMYGLANDLDLPAYLRGIPCHLPANQAFMECIRTAIVCSPMLPHLSETGRLRYASAIVSQC
jgi:hypothetical protein